MAIFESVFGGIFEPLMDQKTWVDAPLSPSSPGAPGYVAVDDLYFYYYRNDAWQRIRLTEWPEWISHALADALWRTYYAYSSPTFPIDFNAREWAISGAL